MVFFRLSLLIIISFVIFSFKGNTIKEDLLIGKWQCVSYETRTEDSIYFVEYTKMIKGINEMTEVPKELVKQNIENLDSAKVFVKEYLQFLLEMKELNRQLTISVFQLEFLENGSAYKILDIFIDSSLWYIDYSKSGNTLLKVAFNGKEKEFVTLEPSFLSYEIEHLSKDSLRLKENYTNETTRYSSFNRIK